MPYVITVKKQFCVVAGLVVLSATTAAAPGPGASRAELMAYSFGCAMAFFAFIWILIRLWRLILQTAVVVAVLLMFYLPAKLVMEAVVGG
jgi:hypothetical protein